MSRFGQRSVEEEYENVVNKFELAAKGWQKIDQETGNVSPETWANVQKLTNDAFGDLNGAIVYETVFYASNKDTRESGQANSKAAMILGQRDLIEKANGIAPHDSYEQSPHGLAAQKAKKLYIDCQCKVITEKHTPAEQQEIIKKAAFELTWALADVARQWNSVILINKSLNMACQANKTISANKGGGCFVATAVYGDYDSPNVRMFRTYRDEKLNTTFVGKLFVRCYYSIGPYLAQICLICPPIKRAIKKLLDSIALHLAEDSKKRKDKVCSARRHVSPLSRGMG